MEDLKNMFLCLIAGGIVIAFGIGMLLLIKEISKSVF